MTSSSQQRLIEERDFLLDSLADLDAEFAAGDLDEVDYHSLHSDYTARAARLIRQIDELDGEAQLPEKESQATGSRRLVWAGLIAVIAVVAGFSVAQFSGSRTSGDSLTGEIRDSPRALIFAAQELAQAGETDAAIERLDQALEQEPTNVEAWTYRGWYQRLGGDTTGAAASIDEAIALDPTYPDARVFAASVALDNDEPLLAVEHLDTLDRMEAPPFTLSLVDQMGLRNRALTLAAAEVQPGVEAALLSDEATPFAESGFEVRDVIWAAEAFAVAGDTQSGLDLLTVLLDHDPTDPEVLAAVGWFVGRASVNTDGEPLTSGLEAALSSLDDALAIDPADPEALVYRAFVLRALERLDDARADLVAFDELDVIRHDLDSLITTSGLREYLNS